MNKKEANADADQQRRSKYGSTNKKKANQKQQSLTPNRKNEPGEIKNQRTHALDPAHEPRSP